MKKTTFFLFFILFNILNSWGQVVIGEGTAVQRYPLGNFYGFERSASIYTADEIGLAGAVVDLAWYANTAGLGPRPIKVYIKETMATQFTPSTWAAQIDGATLVYDSSVIPVEGWNVFTLTDVFVYDGSNNLVILVEANFGGTGNGGGTVGNNVRYSGVTNRHQIFYGDNAPPVGQGTVNSSRPNLKVNVLPLADCVWPLNIRKSNEMLNGVQYNWNIYGDSNYLATEYFLSTSQDGPDDDTEPSGVVNSPNTELILSGLNDETTYYIWFKVKCSDTSTSEWSNVNTFRTLPIGQIGAGTATTTSLPIQSNFGYNYSQQIYTASEVLEAVGANRYINTIKFHFTSTASTASYKDWKIFMGNTTKDNFGGTTVAEWVPASTMTAVFEGEVSFPNPTGDWIEITFSEPFLWDGVSNLVVAVNEYTPGSASGGTFRRMDTGSDYRGVLLRVADPNPNPYNPLAASERFQYVPQIILRGESAVPSCLGVSSSFYTDLTFNSVQLNWRNANATVLATEYFIATSLEQVPTTSTVPTGVINSPNQELVLSNLLEDTQYYVWFRNQCAAVDRSEWSGVPVSFKTLIEGLIGGGTTTSTSLPVQSNWGFGYSQQIYLANEVRTVVDGNGALLITGIKFHINVGSSNVSRYKDWNIYMGNTEKVAFAGTALTEWVSTTTMQQVFDGEVDFPDPTNDWMEITLTDPFVWDGVSNLVVGVQQKTPLWTTTAVFRNRNTSGNRGMLYRSDSNLPDPDNPPVASAVFQFVPQMKIETTVVPACLSPINVRVTDITKNKATFSWRAPIQLPNDGYEYEVRTSGLPGSGTVGFVAGAFVANTIFMQMLTGLLPSTEYFVYMRSRCADRVTSTWTLATKFTTVCDYPEFNIEEEVLICGQGVVELEVHVTGTPGVFKWYETATGGVAVHEGPTFETPLVTANKSYWVEGVSEEASVLCYAERQRVNIVVSTAPELDLNTTALMICEGEDTELVEVITDIGNYDQYEWFPNIGVRGDFQTGWVFSPVVSTDYVLIAKQSSGGQCQTQRSLSIDVKPLPVTTISPTEESLIICDGDVQALEVYFSPDYEVVIGDATTHSEDFGNNTAFNNRWSEGRSQLLFTATELESHGITAGEINSISFDIATPGSSLTNANYTVKIAPTSLSSFASATYITTGFTTVYGPATYTHTDSGWQEIVFDTPYVWDGISSIIVEIASSGANSTNNAQTYYTETINNSLLFGTAAGSVRSKLRYNVVLKRRSGILVTWSPAANVYIDEAATIPYVIGTSVQKVYYKGQTEGYEDLQVNIASGNGCSLIKAFDIRTVVITDVVAENQEFCGVVSVSELVATGQEGARFKWYRQAEVGQALDEATLLGSGTYYVTQLIGSCESETRTPVVVTIKNKPVAPISPNRNICDAGVLSDLQVFYDPLNTLTWYDANQNVIVGNANLVTGVYYVTQKNAVCESDQTQVIITVTATPVAPIAASTQLYCGSYRVSDLVIQLAPGAMANWYASSESTTLLPPNELLRTGTYYGAQSINGCESTRIAVHVSVASAVTAPVVYNQNFCTGNVTVADLEATLLPGARVLWYNTSTAGVALEETQSLNSGLYYASQIIGECESPRVRIGVNIVSNDHAPNANAQSFCGEAKIANLHVVVATGMIVKWYGQEQGGVPLTSDTVLRSGTYYVSQSIYFCESPRRAVEVTINNLPTAPTGDELQEFREEQNSVIGDLVLDQANVVWYASEENALTDVNRLSISMPLMEGAVYYAVLRSAAGCASLPFAVTVKIIKTVGINDFDWSKLTYYPNPVNDILTITYKEVITKIEVYSFTGQRVFTLKNGANTALVEMGGLAPATYVVKIYSNDHSQFIKIVKKQ